MRLGIGQSGSNPHETIDWKAIQALAMEQGLYAIVLDGIEKLPLTLRPPQGLLLGWIGLVMQDEARYAAQQKAAKEMAALFSKNNIRTYVLKGAVIDAMGTGQWHLRYFNDNNNMSRLLMGKGTK